MKSKILFIVLLSYSYLFSQNTTEIFTDNFYSNINEWYEGSDEKRAFSIRDGYYYFEHKQPTKSYNSYQTIEIDQSKDFVIETKIKKISGIQNNGFGLLWGRNDNSDQFEFYISANGYFRINDNDSEIKPWEKTSLINQGNNAINTLKVEKKGDFFNFYINNQYVHSTKFRAFYGDKIGFHIENDQKIAIDYFKIYYLNTATISSSSSIIFEETFSNNNNDWIVGNNKDRSYDLKYGYYYFEHKRDKGSWITSQEVFVDTSKDFKIESNIEKISGVNNYGYGLVFGRKDNDNENQFIISSNGYYKIIAENNGETEEIKPWTISSYIIQSEGGKNKLEIIKTGNNLKYYINSSLVHTSTFKQFIGDRIGFTVHNKQKVGIDNLKVSYIGNITTTNNTFVFNEQFNSNSNYWPTPDNSSINNYFYNGSYYFDKKSESGGEYQTIYASFESTRDFQIDTELTKISGETSSGYGLLFGRKDGENQFLFNITSSGYYRVSKFENGDYTNIIDWTTTTHIKTADGDTNKLTLKKQNNKYNFYINDTFINSIDYSPFYGNNIGYVAFSNQKFSANYLTVKYLDKKSPVVVVTNNNTGDYLLKEEFYDNKLDWSDENNENFHTAIYDGKYHLEHKPESGGWYFGKYTEIDEQKDFEIETNIERVPSTDNGSVGFVFGKKDNDNKYEFFISNNGSYLLRKYIDGEKTIVFKWTESSYIATGYAPNSLKIKKTGNTYRFYINNQYLNKTDIYSLPSYKFGWVLYERTKIAVDYLKIKYLKQDYNNPPEIEITEPTVVERGFKIVKAKKITVKGKATDSDGIYEVLINGVDAYVSANGNFNAEVPLKFGDNELIVKASDIKGKSTTKKFYVKRESPVVVINNDNDDDDIVTTNNGKYYALLIGVSDYGDTKIVDLEGLPNKDAEGLATILKTNYNFKYENVKVLINATRTSILNAFDDLRKKTTDKDNLLIFYAGHGVYEDDSEVGYWLPSDAEKNYTANWIQNSVVVSSIKRIKAKHTLLISDACFSGSIFKTRSLTSDAPKAYQKLYELPSRRAITSGTLKTVPNKSIFYKYLTDRLKNNNSKYMSALELFTNIKIPVANNSPNVPQYGVIHGIGDEGGDFIFIKN